jgi:hypothetical protein
VFIFDAEARLWRPDVPDLYPRRIEVQSPTRCRVVLGQRQSQAPLRPGDLVAFKKHGHTAFLFMGCGDVHVRDVTLHNASLAGFLLRMCTGKPVFEHCTIERGPRPAGATQDRLLSIGADGFNIGYSRHGADLRNCDFSFMGDDSVNYHGTVIDVVDIEDERTVWVARTGSPEPLIPLRPGDTARFMEPRSFRVTAAATIDECKITPPPAERDARARKLLGARADQRLYFGRLRLREPVKVRPGDQVELPDIACPGFTIENCYFHDHRARGIRTGAHDGRIVGNRFERIKSTAISLGPHAIHHEGGWVRNVEVRGNTIRDCTFEPYTLAPGSYHPGAIVVQHFVKGGDVPYPQENTGLRIVGNTIDRVGGAGILLVSASDTLVAENEISRTQMVDCTGVGKPWRIAATTAVAVNHSRNVTLRDNRFGPRGPHCTGETGFHDSPHAKETPRP